MKPNEKNFERLLKRVLKGEKVSEQDFLFHWRGLGKSGDRLLINLLNRTSGWDRFLQWSAELPEIKKGLSFIANLPGISDNVFEGLRATGVAIPETDEGRKMATWILNVAEKDLEQEWGAAREMLQRNPEIMDGVLALIEQNESPTILRFLKSLLEEPWLPEQDQQIRKSIYRRKQKSPEAFNVQSQIVAQRELFAFAENRLPLSQLIFYFRPHSAFSPKGDLYFLSIVEGQNFESSQRAKDTDIDTPTMERIARQYSERLKGEYRIETVFHVVEPVHARYFLQKSLDLLAAKSAAARLTEFIRFIGAEPIADPLLPLKQARETLIPSEITEISRHPYFAAWLIPLDSLGDLFSKLQNLKSGPIILPESQLKQREHSEKLAALRSYFARENRAAWSLAFEKAAFFLRQSDPRIAAGCLLVSEQLSDSEIEADNIPAASILLERTLQYQTEQQRLREQEDKRTSLIMSPEEFEKSLQRKK